MPDELWMDIVGRTGPEQLHRSVREVHDRSAEIQHRLRSAIDSLPLDVGFYPEDGRMIQRTLWEVIQRYNLDFRIQYNSKGDAIFYIFRPPSV